MIESKNNFILPTSLIASPLLSQWIAVSADGYVELSPGKVEIGQGITTVLVQIAADELDVAVDRIKLRRASTSYSPNEGVTSGSLSVHDCGMSVRLVAAKTRALLLSAAATRLGVDPDRLTVNDGTIYGPGNLSTSYWEVADSVSLARPADLSAPTKDAAQRKLSGQSVPRLDIPGRVFATQPYIHDYSSLDMLHGRVLRAPRPGAQLKHFSEAALKSAQGIVTVVRDGNFLGVVCDSEANATRALELLASNSDWHGGFELPDENDLVVWLRNQPTETSDVDLSLERTSSSVSSRCERYYVKPFLAHASIGPSCALARWSKSALHVLSHTQGVYNLRADLALVFGLQEDQIVVEHVEGAGCYGHNGADDVALDAALLARAVQERTVRVLWSRSDELSSSPFGAGMAMRMAAALNDQGKVAEWEHEIWSNGHVARPGRSNTPALLASFEVKEAFPRYLAYDPPLLSGGGGAHRNAVPIYDFPVRTIRKHRILNAPLRTSSMRSLGAYGNVFAIESFMDELATEIGADPLEFRLLHLNDERARTVLERVAAMSSWGSQPLDGRGRGIAMARYKNTSAYCAIVAEIDLNQDPRATRLWIAADVGEAISPDGVANQIEGGAIQATSWTLKEEVRFTRSEIVSKSWESYPILRFSEVPDVEIDIIPHPDKPPLGAGEAAQGPTAAALANAVYAAIGIRIRQLPITRDRIIAAMQ